MDIRCGIIGLGFMGMTHFEALRSVTGAHVAAIATRDPRKRAGDWSGIQGNFGPRGSATTDLGDIKTYSTAQELLRDPEIDLVQICLPTDQHESATIEALQHGKHVLVEKPIAVELEAAQRMLAAAQTAGRMLMVAHPLPYFPEFHWACEHVTQRRSGKLLGASFRRVIAPPDWGEGFQDFRKLGGWGIDLHIHDNHLIQVLCGQPRGVFSRGRLKEGFIEHVSTQYLFDDPDLTVSCISGGIAAAPLKFAQSFELFCEEGTLQFDAGTYGPDWVVNRPAILLKNSGEIETPPAQENPSWCSAYTLEIQAAVDAIRSQTMPVELDPHSALLALTLCYAEARSIEQGTAVLLEEMSPDIRSLAVTPASNSGQ